MGAWGTGNFENDSAMDFIESAESEDIETVLSAAVSPLAELDNDQCCFVLAAAEVVASAAGHAIIGAPEHALRLARSIHVSPGVMSQARTAVRRVLRAGELRELWDDPAALSTWEEVVGDLLHRLDQPILPLPPLAMEQSPKAIELSVGDYFQVPICDGSVGVVQALSPAQSSGGATLALFDPRRSRAGTHNLLGGRADVFAVVHLVDRAVLDSGDWARLGTGDPVIGPGASELRGASDGYSLTEEGVVYLLECRLGVREWLHGPDGLAIHSQFVFPHLRD